jgi:PPOX class probable F420-dependent enzyme
MELSPAQRAFLEANHAAAMITLRDDGTPHAVRVGVAVVDGRVWSSGLPSRARTRHVRRDPRATLFVFDQAYAFLSLEARVRILDGPDAPEQSLRLFEAMQRGLPNVPPGMLLWHGTPRTRADFVRIMADEQRLIYEFEPLRAYGLA